jgi:hypothetical protein
VNDDAVRARFAANADRVAESSLRRLPALEAVAVKVLEEHVQHCVSGALASGDPELAAEKSRELLEAVQRFAKTR